MLLYLHGPLQQNKIDVEIKHELIHYKAFLGKLSLFSEINISLLHQEIFRYKQNQSICFEKKSVGLEIRTYGNSPLG